LSSVGVGVMPSGGHAVAREPSSHSSRLVAMGVAKVGDRPGVEGSASGGGAGGRASCSLGDGGGGSSS